MEPGSSAYTGDLNLLDRILQRMSSGEAVDLEALIAEHPEQADEIRQLAAVVQFVQSAANEQDAGESLDARVKVGRRRPTLGDFRIEREIARGGMGVVYEAVQESLNRRVALKVLLPGVTFSEDAIERFSREARMTGGMHHRHIVPIYAVGEADGVPYYAMQFIDGHSLSTFIEERRDAGLTSDAAYFRRVAEWGRQAAEGLAYAHGHGVVHRDVKPSNLLLDGDDQIWVTDFGLARQSANVTITMSGDLLGTVRYMSPEQARGGGAVDERTDVYSLGVSLYEMACLRPAFEGPDRASTLKKVLLDEPQRLRHRAAGIPGPLEIIIHTAMDKEPERRFPSAAVMAEELQRFLDGRPLLTQPPGAFEQFRRLVARHKAPFAFLGVLLVVVLGFGVWMSVLYGVAEGHRLTAERERGEAVEARDAEQAARLAAERETEKAVQIQTFLGDMLASVDPTVAQGRDDTLLREILEKAADRIENELADQPEVRAAIHAIIGQTYLELARHEEAETHLSKALDIYGLDTKHALDAASVMNNLAIMHYRQRRLPQAETLFRTALEIMVRELGEDDSSSTSCLINLATALAEQGKLAAAEEIYRRGLETFRRLEGDEGPTTIWAMSNVATMLQARKAYSESEAMYREALDISLRVFGETDQASMVLMGGLVAPLIDLGKLEEAEEWARRALRLFQRVYGDDHPETMITMSSLARVLHKLERWDEAETMSRKMIEMTAQRRGPEDPRTVIYRLNLASLLRDAGRFEEAEPIMLDGLPKIRAAFGETHDHTIAALERLVTLYEKWGKPQKAAEYRDMLPPETDKPE